MRALAGHPAIGEAYYQQAEMHRLRGEYDDAEAAYRARQRASAASRSPGSRCCASRRATSTRPVAIDPSGRRGRPPAPSRARVLAASVEIMLAAGDVARPPAPPPTS